MTQQPFSRPGAIDLSGLKKPAAPAGGAPGSPASGGGGAAYSVVVSEQNFQEVVESSTTAPVILVLHSPGQSPESTTYAQDVAAAVESYEGRFLVATVDVDAVPSIVQALQVEQIPVLMVLMDGRPVTQPIPGALNAEEIDTLLNQLGQQLTSQGVTGRHQPRGAAPDPAEVDQEPGDDPRYAAAQEALADDDVDRAVAEYQKLLDANPADGEAVAGLAMAKVLQRTQGADPTRAREDAAAEPDDVAKQTLVSDLDLLAGHVEDAFGRLIDLIGRTSDAERSQAREHLLGLFAAVGHDDPRVLKGRQGLASALF